MFLFILVVAFALTVNKEELLKPRVALLFVFALSLSSTASTIQFLMLALMMIAYAKIDSKYAFVPLGLCAALQQELWVPVVLLLVYSLNRHGIKKGAYNVIGAAAVFLAINAYFIALGPSAYFGAILGTLNKSIIPVAPSSFSFALMRNYAVPLSTYPMLFKIMIAIAILVVLYTNRKELIPMFSFITLITLTHALLSYYVFFLFLMFFAVSTWQKQGKDGVFQKFLKKRKVIFYSGLIALIAFAAFTIYASHATYARDFDIRLVNQSIAIDSNRTVVSGDILYRNLSNNTVFIWAIAGGKTITTAGFANQSIIASPQRCAASDYTCLVNVNRIALPENATSYHITVSIPWENSTAVMNGASIQIYNGDYYYLGDPVFDQSKPT